MEPEIADIIKQLYLRMLELQEQQAQQQQKVDQETGACGDRLHEDPVATELAAEEGLESAAQQSLQTAPAAVASADVAGGIPGTSDVGYPSGQGPQQDAAAAPKTDSTASQAWVALMSCLSR